MTFPRSSPSTPELSPTRLRRGLWVCLALALAGTLGSQGGFVLGAEKKPKKPLPPVLLGGNDLVSDGVQLTATYFPGTEGKESLPVILLHAFKGSGKEYVGLAPFLQNSGCAVLVPDLRGHGGSTQVVGSSRKLEADKMSGDQVRQMPYNDMETLRRFLVQKNDAEELNLSKLCIVGTEMGATVAAYYTAWDWLPARSLQIAEGGRARFRPGPDVKALVLLSPKWSFQGLPLSKPLSQPGVRSQVSMLLVVGKDDPRSFSDAKRAYNLLERYRDGSGEENAEKNLFFGQLPTKLQGSKILGVKDLKLDWAIGKFIEDRLVKQQGQAFLWRRRGSGGP